MREVKEAFDNELLRHVLKDFAYELMKHSTGDILNVMREAELSMPQLVTLMFLSRCRTASISHISDHLNLSLGATSHLVDRLFVGGFVERTEGRNDRRQKLVTLTDAGTAFVERAKQARVEELARRLGQLPAPLVQNLIDVMAEVIGHVRSNDGDSRPRC